MSLIDSWNSPYIQQFSYWLFGHYPSFCFLFNRRFCKLDSACPQVKSLLTWVHSIELIPIPGLNWEWSQESSLWNVVLNKKPGLWIMSKKSVIVLIHCCLKLLNLIYTVVVDFFSLVLFHACFECCKLSIQVLWTNGPSMGGGMAVTYKVFNSRLRSVLISLQKWKRWKCVTVKDVGNELVSCVLYFQKNSTWTFYKRSY
jgi:hypothetical protein